MYEYRIRAYFTKVYTPRSYKRKVVYTLEEAEALYHEAVEYYYGYNYLDRIVIEGRRVSEWEPFKEHTTKDYK